MSTIPDITIIGGGIMGLLTARECRLAGASVRVIEKGAIGQESSWAGGGILLPIYPWRQHQAITDLVIQSLKLYPDLVASIQETTQKDPEFVQSGMLICKNPDLSDAVNWCETNKIAYGNPPQVFYEQFQHAFDQPLWLPEIHQARNPRLLKAVHANLIDLNVEFITHSELTQLHIDSHRVQAISTRNGDYPVDQLVITTGAWTGTLWQQLFIDHPTVQPDIQPIKGQMLLFDALPDTLTTMILDGAHYLIPRIDGKIIAGSTVEQCGFDKNIDAETLEYLSAFAQQLLPALKHYPIVAHWAGLRPGTEQGIPYIALHPTLENLSINAGHFRNGLTMAPASAQLITDLILKRSPQIAPEPYQFDSIH